MPADRSEKIARREEERVVKDAARVAKERTGPPILTLEDLSDPYNTDILRGKPKDRPVLSLTEPVKSPVIIPDIYRDTELEDYQEDDRTFRGLRGTRISGLRAPTAASEMMHYSDKYGMSLSKSQYEALEKNQSDLQYGLAVANNDLIKARYDSLVEYEDAKKAASSFGNQIYNAGSIYKQLVPNPDYQEGSPESSKYIMVNARGAGGYESTVKVPLTVGEAISMYQRDGSVGKGPYATITEQYLKNSGIVSEKYKSGVLEFAIKDTVWDKNMEKDFFSEFVNKYQEENLVPVHISGGSMVSDWTGMRVKDVYYLPPEAVSTMVGSLSSGDASQVFAVSKNQDGGYNIHIKDGDYAQQIYEPLEMYRYRMQDTMMTAYDKALSTAAEEGLATIESDYATKVIPTLAQRQAEIEGYQNLNTEALTTLRMKYQEKLSGIQDTLGGLING